MRLLTLSILLAGCSYDFESYVPVDGVDARADTSVSDTPSGTCADADGKVLNGHCYFPIGATSWDSARVACSSLGAHLVTITSAAEESFVETIRPGTDRWLGFRKTGAEFAWITGEVAPFTKWGSGEPNASGDCARLRNSNDWGDQSCSNSEIAICERE